MKIGLSRVVVIIVTAALIVLLARVFGLLYNPVYFAEWVIFITVPSLALYYFRGRNERNYSAFLDRIERTTTPEEKRKGDAGGS